MKAVSNESDLSLVESTASMSDTSFIKTSSGMVIDDVGVTDVSVLAEPEGGVSEDSTDASVVGDELAVETNRSCITGVSTLFSLTVSRSTRGTVSGTIVVSASNTVPGSNLAFSGAALFIPGVNTS